MKDLNIIKDYLSSPKDIIITMHSNADADALGSSLGLYHFLKQKGHKVQVIAPDAYADFITWMDGNDQVIVFEEEKEKATEKLEQADLICCLDFSGYSRMKGMSEVVKNATNLKVMLVDHHLNPEIVPDFNFWNDQAAATAELIYDFIVAYDGLEAITPNIAECLYAGIMTDTGSFKHPSTTAKIHRTVANLIDRGANVNKVSRAIYDNNTFGRLKLLGYALSQKMKVDMKARVAYLTISNEDNKKFNIKKGDTEGLVNYALSIKGIVVAAIIIEREGEVKLSFRSVEEYAVNAFANEYFSGGGHKNASGGMSELSLEETEHKFVDLLINKNLLNTRIN